jgi:hypothetical protein
MSEPMQASIPANRFPVNGAPSTPTFGLAYAEAWAISLWTAAEKWGNLAPQSGLTSQAPQQPAIVALISSTTFFIQPFFLFLR